MRQLRALDLFCGAGGATKGLQSAGFHVTGVDINPQPRYCGDMFTQGDATTYPLEGFDLIWASPPCQAFALAALKERSKGKVYPNLIPVTRKRLSKLNTAWVIENVPGAPIRKDLLLCGAMFGLNLVRHRLFESNFHMEQPTHETHPAFPVPVCGHGTPSWVRSSAGRSYSILEQRYAMGMHWSNRGELSEAIPPAYSEYIAKQIIGQL